MFSSCSSTMPYFVNQGYLSCCYKRGIPVTLNYKFENEFKGLRKKHLLPIANGRPFYAQVNII
jgi:hypothetical protein